MNLLNEYLDTLGEIGSMKRIEVISNLNLGERSHAAKLVIEKRSRRIELMEKGLTFEHACLIVNSENSIEK